jgi:predicted Zn finger-like uncharacterized protein
MDVRCERCTAQYVFDGEQVTPSGLTVQCMSRGHVFKVKKKELVVTVPVKPDELDRAPLPTAAAPRAARSAEPDRAREWRVRQASGGVFAFKELTTLQKGIVEQKVSRDEALIGRGLCYLDLSRYPPAEASFQAALRIDPKQADAPLGLAETYRWQGRRGEAIKYYQEHLADHPDGDEAAVARNAIAQLRE